MFCSCEICCRRSKHMGPSGGGPGRALALSCPCGGCSWAWLMVSRQWAPVGSGIFSMQQPLALLPVLLGTLFDNTFRCHLWTGEREWPSCWPRHWWYSRWPSHCHCRQCCTGRWATGEGASGCCWMGVATREDKEGTDSIIAQCLEWSGLEFHAARTAGGHAGVSGKGWPSKQGELEACDFHQQAYRSWSIYSFSIGLVP